MKKKKQPAIVTNFNSLSRFGHSNDLSLLVGENPEDYYSGLLFFGSFYFSVFVSWGIVIIILKCIGPKDVGVLAGFPYREEGKNSMDGRIVLSISAWMMMVSTIVLVSKGLAELQGLADTTGIINNDIIQFFEVEVQSVVETLSVANRKTKPLLDDLSDIFERDICPLQSDIDTLNQIKSFANETYGTMVELDVLIEGYVGNAESGIDKTKGFTNVVKDIMGSAQLTDNPKVTAIFFPYFIVPAFLLVAVAMGMHEVFNEGFYTFISWVILPLMIVLTVVAIIAAGWMPFVIQANSDFCSPRPEDTILNILNRLDNNDNSGSGPKYGNGTSDNALYDIVVFYSHQCTTANPWEVLKAPYTELVSTTSKFGT